MNKKQTKLIGLILTIVMIFALAALVSSCGGPKITEIYISKSDLPRVSYVEGQELDLSKGKLTAVIDGEETRLPLDSEEITVSGYDKDLIGKQTLTVTYKEQTCTFNVTVAERAVAEGFEAKYFVGSEFNPVKGKIKITTDDAKSFYVNMNDSTVSLVSFDSATAGTSTVTVLYNNGIDAYYCQFDVTVYEQSNIEFTPPKNTDYLSHYTGKPDVNGGYFKVTSSDSTLTMNVPLTESMIEGFDPSLATIENRTTPLEQTLTVNYLDATFTYKVYVTFSGVSAVNYYANTTLSAIDMEVLKTDGLSEEESAAALAAMTEYYALSDADKALICDEVKAIIAIPGAIAAREAFYDELGTYSNSFRLGTDLNIYFIRTSYENTAADVERLNDTKEEINVYSALLRNILAEFGEMQYSESEKIKDIAYVYSYEMELAFKDVLNHFVDVYKLLKDIPTEWTSEMLKPYGANIIEAALRIYNAGYYKSGYTGYYTNILSPWREENDLFEIIYSYVLYQHDNGSEFMTTYMWGSMPMPGLLEDWYLGLNSCIKYSSTYSAYAKAGQSLIDVSPYMYTYFRTLEICEEIKASGNQFWIDIYNAYNGDYMNRVYMYNYSYGYLSYTKGMIDSAAYHELWDRYYDLLVIYYTTGAIDSEKNAEEIRAMFTAFEALNPTELLGFISSMSLSYTSGNGKYPMLGYTHVINDDGSESDVVYNTFSYIISNYFAAYLTETNQVLLNDLLSAMESFALSGYKDGALADFNAKMAALSAKISALEGEDASNFAQYFSTSYNKYFELYEITSGAKTIELSEKEVKIIGDYINYSNKFFVVYSNIYSLVVAGKTVPDDAYPILYALYARVSELRAQLLESGSENALLAAYTTEYDISGLKYTIEKSYFIMDSVSTSVLEGMTAFVTLNGSGTTYASYWELYNSNGMQALLSSLADVFYQIYFTDDVVLDHATYVEFMKQFRQMESFKKSIFILFNADDAFYNSLNKYYSTVLSTDGLTVYQMLSVVAQTYDEFSIYKKTETYNTFVQYMGVVAPRYEALSDADKAYLEEMYTYYSEIDPPTDDAEEV